MPISLINHVKGSVTSANSFTTTAINTVGSNLIVLGVSQYLLATTLGVPSDSTSLTWNPLTLQSEATHNSWCRIYYANGPSIGNASHTFTLTGNTFYGVLFVLAFSGAAASPLDASQNGATSENLLSVAPGSITPSQPGSLVVSSMAALGTMTAAPTNSTVTLADPSNISNTSSGSYVGAGFGYIIQTAAIAANPSWAWTGTASATGASSSVAAFHAQAVFPVGLNAMTPIQIWDH